MLYNCAYILIYIFLVLNLLTPCDSDYKCANCAKENAKLCQIEKATGFSCFTRTSKASSHYRHIKKYVFQTAPMTDDTKVCIPPGVQIDSGAEICCAWSPHTGCNLILEKSHKGEFCSTCRLKSNEYEGLEICPCTSVGRSGSEKLISGGRTILIRMAVGFYILRHILNLLY